MKVWVTRDMGSPGHCDIRGGSDKPTRYGQTWENYGTRMYIPLEEVREVVNFTPRKGSCKQYELTLKEIE